MTGEQQDDTRRIRPLADAFTPIYQSPDTVGLFCYSPGLCVLPSGRMIATIDLGGPSASSLPGPKYERGERGWSWQGRVLTSDDRGQTWTHRCSYPFMHARPFVAGNTVYVLGHAGDLRIIASRDGGVTWSAPAALTEGSHWHQAPCNVHYANGCVYLVMEKRTSGHIQTWPVGELAPVLMRGRVDDDLLAREKWTFASELSFADAVPRTNTDPDLDYFGVPFYRSPYPRGGRVSSGRSAAPIGWLETNVVQFVDPDHLWHDPEGKTFHLWMRAHTGGTGYAAIARVVEWGQHPGTGPMTTELVEAPSGKKMLYLPCPGGQMKFHIIYDDLSRLYWLLSTQATDSMRRPERLSDDRYNLPNNERRRLQLHFSRNCVDWCFAGLVAVGPSERGSRHYASMAVVDDDLYIASRSGDERAVNAHDTDLISLHRLEGFRDLAYVE